MLVVSLMESPMRSKKPAALEVVPKTVKRRKRLKKVKKKFLEMRESSISPWEIMPCRLESPRVC